MTWPRNSPKKKELGPSTHRPRGLSYLRKPGAGRTTKTGRQSRTGSSGRSKTG